MAEVLTLNDGYFSWVSASGISGGWKTGSSPPSGANITYFQGITVRSAQSFAPIRNRGKVDHLKFQANEYPMVDISYLYTGGAGIPNYSVNFEVAWKPEAQTNSAWYQFTHCRRTNQSLSERSEGNIITESYLATQYSAKNSGHLISIT